jgi:hypothetical protein
MTKISTWLSPKLLGLSPAVSAPIAVAGEYLSPRFYSAGTDGKVNSSTILLWTGAALAASVFALFLLTVLFENAKPVLETGRKKPLGKAFGGLLGTIGLLTAASLVISLLYGLLAVLIHTVLKSTFSLEQIKGIINISTMVLTWLVSPLYISALFTYRIDSEKPWKAFTGSLKIGGHRYIKILVLVAAVFAAGWLTTLPFRYADMTLPLEIARTAIVTAIGMFSILFAIALYTDESKNEAGGKKEALIWAEIPSQAPLTQTEEKEPVTV